MLCVVVSTGSCVVHLFMFRGRQKETDNKHISILLHYGKELTVPAFRYHETMVLHPKSSSANSFLYYLFIYYDKSQSSLVLSSLQQTLDNHLLMTLVTQSLLLNSTRRNRGPGENANKRKKGKHT